MNIKIYKKQHKKNFTHDILSIALIYFNMFS